MRKMFLALAVISPACPASAEEAGRQMIGAFLAGRSEALWEAFTPEMRDLFGSVEALVAFREGLARDLGSEAEVLSERMEEQGEAQVVTRVARWTGSPAPIEIVLTLDGAGRVAGLVVRPEPVAAPSRFLDYQTKAPLRLPVTGEWLVVWGGRTLEENYHAADAGQRFALDLVALRDGARQTGDPALLESYACWGQPVLAPAAGRVVSAVDGHPDQPIGQSDPAHPAGNHVVIDLGDGEFAFLAHLKEGSLAVAEGQEVTQAQRLGACGNSGNSSEPHLHFHLQTTPVLGTGEGLPAAFLGYVADGKPVTRGEPRQGEVITPGG